MANDLELRILNKLISDIHGRYGLEQLFREDQRISLSIYEKWREIISKELFDDNIINEPYAPVKVDKLSLTEVLTRHDFYLLYGQEYFEEYGFGEDIER